MDFGSRAVRVSTDWGHTVKARFIGVGITLVVGASAAWAAFRSLAPFPHLEHEGVFPTCIGCHIGIQTGERDDYYPPPSDCANCHDGTTEERVEWTGPVRAASNLNFDHVRHVTLVQASGDSTACASCHQQADRTERMAVGRPRPETCIECHAHEASMHLAEAAECLTCHLPTVGATQMTIAQIGDFPTLPNHEADDFLTTHGSLPGAGEGTCAVCHARESCERCHLNATAVPAISRLAPDSRFATLVRERDAEYPVPESHGSDSWSWSHAAQATAASTSCSNCHAQPSCQACHGSAQIAAIRALPTPGSDGRSGVTFAEPGPSVHAPGFAMAHGSQAGATEATCGGCHTDTSFCLNCHQGPGERAFHVANFRERHSAMAYGNELECTSCHNTEVFCRGCHVGNGLGSGGRLDVAFHTAEPFWLLGHGQAARRGLENCVSCHTQSNCMQCHSSVGAWRINPHGPGFDPTRVQEQNRLTCLRCHLSEPTGQP